MGKLDIELIKSRYYAGMKIELISMKGESQMCSGLRGTVQFVDDVGQIHVCWENGSSLALNTLYDRFNTC